MDLPKQEFSSLSRSTVPMQAEADRQLTMAAQMAATSMGSFAKAVQSGGGDLKRMSQAHRTEAAILQKRVKSGLLFERNFESLIKEMQNGQDSWAKYNLAINAVKHNMDDLVDSSKDMNEVVNELPKVMQRVMKKLNHNADVQTLTQVNMMREYVDSHQRMMTDLASNGTAQAVNVQRHLELAKSLGLSIEDFTEQVLGLKRGAKGKGVKHRDFDNVVASLKRVATRRNENGQRLSDNQLSAASHVINKALRSNVKNLNAESLKLVQIMQQTNSEMARVRASVPSIYRGIIRDTKQGITSWIDSISDPKYGKIMAAGYAASAMVHIKAAITTIADQWAYGLREQLRSGTNMPSLTDMWNAQIGDPTAMAGVYKDQKQLLLSLNGTYADINSVASTNYKDLFNTFGGDPKTMFKESAALLSLSKQTSAVGASLDQLKSTQKGYITQVQHLARITGKEPDAIVRNMEAYMADADIREAMSKMGERERNLMLQSNMARQTELVNMGMSADKALEFTKAMDKSMNATFLDRRKSAIRMQQIAAIIGFDQTKTKKMVQYRARERHLTPEERAEYDKLRLEYGNQARQWGAKSDDAGGVGETILDNLSRGYDDIAQMINVGGNETPQMAKQRQSEAGAKAGIKPNDISMIGKGFLDMTNLMTMLKDSGLASLALGVTQGGISALMLRNSYKNISLLSNIRDLLARGGGGGGPDDIDGPDDGKRSKDQKRKDRLKRMRNNRGGGAKGWWNRAKDFGSRGLEWGRQGASSLMNFGRMGIGEAAAMRGGLGALGVAGGVAGAGLAGYGVGDWIHQNKYDDAAVKLMTGGKVTSLSDAVWNMFGTDDSKFLDPTPIPVKKPITPKAPFAQAPQAVQPNAASPEVKEVAGLTPEQKMVNLLSEQNNLMKQLNKLTQQQLELSGMSEQAKMKRETDLRQGRTFRTPSSQ